MAQQNSSVTIKESSLEIVFAKDWSALSGFSHLHFILGVDEKGEFACLAKTIDGLCDNVLKKHLKAHSFEGKNKTANTTHISSHLLPNLGLKSTNASPLVPVTVVGLKKEISSADLEEIGALAFKAASKTADMAILDMATLTETAGRDSSKSASLIAFGALLRSWAFDIYKTKKDDEASGSAPKLKKLVILTNDPENAIKEFEFYKAVAHGNFITRHVASEPPNVLYPESMAEIAQGLEPLGVKVEILGEAQMRSLGFNALLGVGQGSAKESKLIILSWMNGDPKEAPIALVGKGVTFDSGGISIKPSANMEDMKMDMAGSGAVLGVLKALALCKAPINVVGVMGMAENMPSGTAQRPADIVKSLSGQTIEILNTDAEGRLVLADALWYTQDRFKPKYMIDLATLTGAVVVALGHEYGGLFSNDEELAHKLLQVGESVGEKLWRLPLHANYDKEIDSPIADVKNTGSGRGAGSCTAAQFLQRFVNKTPWAHLDIAGVEMDKKDKPLTGKGATGFGVHLLMEWLATIWKEQK